MVCCPELTVNFKCAYAPAKLLLSGGMSKKTEAFIQDVKAFCILDL
jgi:hypothetical protein